MKSATKDELLSLVLWDSSMLVRRDAATRLEGERLTSESTSAIRTALADGDALVRRRGAALLQVLAFSPPVDQLLRLAVADPSWVVRESGVQSVARHLAERPELLQMLVDRSLHDRNRLVRTRALQIVQASVDVTDCQSVVAVYLAAAGDRRFAVRCRALKFLAQLKRPSSQVIETLVAAADDPHEKVRSTLLDLLPEMDEPLVELVPVLSRRFFDRKPEHQRLVSDYFSRTAAQVDKVTNTALSLLVGGHDPGDRLSAILGHRDIETAVGDKIRAIAVRRIEWAASMAGVDPDPITVSPSSILDAVDQAVERAASLSATAHGRRRRRQHVWFIGQIFECLQTG